MTENRRLFTSYKTHDGGHVVFRSNIKGNIIGGGNITHDSITVTNVKHVRGQAFNLIIVGQLCDDDCVVSFNKIDCAISKNGKTLAKGHRRNELHTCKLGDNSKQQICLASVVDNSTLWHRRLGHANMRESSEHPATQQQHDRSNRDPSKTASLKNLSKENPEAKTLDKAKRVQPSPGTPIMNNTIAWNLPLVKQQTRLGRHLLELENIEVAFHSNTCYVRNLEGEDLLTGSRDSNLYTIFNSEMAASSLVCLMSKATLTKSWLWHRRLSHLNFDTNNHLNKQDLVDGLLKFKYDKDHLCSACEQEKSKKATLSPKLVPSIKSKLELIHMDLYRPMRVESIKDKRYILVIVDDKS
ncbi:retrovirus-related pol polyprotein from transposon TNT 1-94 [Tanacetum coccineum]